mgnify:CR=1 FL=1
MYLKYLLRFILVLIILLVFIGTFQSISYDPKYINRATIQIDFNKIRTPFIKKIFLKT